MRTLWQDICYGARMPMKRPGLTVNAAVVLALGIGANTALFSLIYTVLLGPLPFPQADRIMLLELEWSNGLRSSTSSGPDYLDRVERNTVFESMCAIEYYSSGFALTGAGEPLALKGLRATSSFFPTIQARMTLDNMPYTVVGVTAPLGFLEEMAQILVPLQERQWASENRGLHGLTLLGCYVPARRAAKVDPIAALGYE